MPDDAVLLKRYAERRDAEAFSQLVRRHAGLVHGVALRILSNAHEAEDVAQECFMQFARHAGTIRVSIPGWLHATATHLASRALQNRTARRRHERASAMQTNGTATEPKWEEIAPYVDHALADLPEELRVPLILHYMEGKTQEEIAAELSVHRSTISRRLDSGVEELRNKLKKAGVVATAALLAALLAQNTASAVPAVLAATLGKMAMAGVGGGTGAAASAGTAIVGMSVATKVGIAVAAAAVVVTGIVVAAGNVSAPTPPQPAVASTPLSSAPPTTTTPTTAPALPASRAWVEQFASDIADHAVNGLRALHLPYAGEPELKAIHAEFKGMVARYVPESLPDQRRKDILLAVDRYMPRYFVRETSAASPSGYLAFPDDLLTLQWKLAACLRRELPNADELRRREEQREWMRNLIRSLPEPEGALRALQVPPGSLREAGVKLLQEEFDDPLSPLADLTASEERFQSLKEQITALGPGHLWRPESALGPILFWALKCRLQLSPPPLDDKVVSYGVNGFNPCLSFASNAQFAATDLFISDDGLSGDAPLSFLSVARRYVIHMDPATSPERMAEVLEAEHGDLRFDKASQELVAVRGAKVTRLDVNDWMAADRVKETELEELVNKGGRDRISAAEFAASPWPKPAPPAAFLILTNREGRLAVLRVFQMRGGSIEFTLRIRR